MQHRLQRLVLCTPFQGRQWRLPVDDGASGVPADRCLVGWKVAPDVIDDDVPAPATRLLAGALCALFTVTFPSGLRRPIGAGLLPRKWRAGRHFEWVTTRDAAAAEALFHDGLFSWSQQGQVVVLSADGTGGVSLSERHLEVLSQPELFQELSNLGAQGVMLPGVDGQVAGLYLFSSESNQALLRALADQAQAAGAEHVNVAEAGFAELLR
jgi:hypothetical protein